MSEPAENFDMSEEEFAAARQRMDVRISEPQSRLDIVTVSGLIIALGLIISALVVGGSPQAFINPAAFMIVIGGTMAVTAICYLADDLAKLGGIIWGTIVYQIRSPSQVARELLDIAVIARQKGILALGDYHEELKKDIMLKNAVDYLVDGFTTEKIYMIMARDIESANEQGQKSAGILRKAAEVAPAMGLIGTLVGLVQMLSVLKDPSSIGPAMAIALLTTFYGALLGTVVIGPLAAKVERKTQKHDLIKRLIMLAVLSISNKENPRQLELEMNALLPADERIVYFS